MLEVQRPSTSEQEMGQTIEIHAAAAVDDDDDVDLAAAAAAQTSILSKEKVSGGGYQDPEVAMQALPFDPGQTDPVPLPWPKG